MSREDCRVCSFMDNIEELETHELEQIRDICITEINFRSKENP